MADYIKMSELKEEGAFSLQALSQYEIIDDE
jgi:hypothetical protein